MTPPAHVVGTAAITENLLKRKWSAAILRYLEQGVSDPAEILKREDTLSASVMNERLRTMVRYNLISRYPRPAPSMVVEYRMTSRGQRILKLLDYIEQLDEIPLGKERSPEPPPPAPAAVLPSAESSAASRTKRTPGGKQAKAKDWPLIVPTYSSP